MTIRTRRHDIFISYFRNFSGQWPIAIKERLERWALSTPACDGVFLDTSELRAGVEWPIELRERVSQSRIFLLLITPQWEGGEVHEKLADNENWVRREILCALDSGVHIIPLMVGADKPIRLPATIPRPILDIVGGDRLQFHKFRDAESWEGDAEQFCRILEEHLISHPRTNFVARESKHTLCRLDRAWESNLVREAFADSRRVFTVRGDLDDAPEMFALRCALDLRVDSEGVNTQQAADPIRLSWDNYSLGWTTPEKRQEALTKDALQGLGIEPGRNPQKTLRAAVQSTAEFTVFYTFAAPASGRQIQYQSEWLHFWYELLKRDNRGQILVLLFERRRWLGPIRVPAKIDSSAGRNLERLHRSGLGKIRWNDVRDFIGQLESDLSPPATVIEELEERNHNLFRLPMGVRMKKVIRALQPVIDSF